MKYKLYTWFAFHSLANSPNVFFLPGQVGELRSWFAEDVEGGSGCEAVDDSLNSILPLGRSVSLTLCVVDSRFFGDNWRYSRDMGGFVSELLRVIRELGGVE